MDILQFTLKGKTAFFKKPDVNTYCYFTYGHIHKVTLLGIFGSIVGYGGYSQQREMEFPEFYEKLRDIKIAIVPRQATFAKKTQVFNNSVGYASQEQGGNLIIKEQWLENPEWDIYVICDSEPTRDLANAIANRSAQYIPYLGKNDHIADIGNCIIHKEVEKLEQAEIIDSLCLKKCVEFMPEILNNDFAVRKRIYKMEEKLPIALEPTANQYEYETFILTNARLKMLEKGEQTVYKLNEKNIAFF